jgi:hypothetical protein
MIEPRRQGGGGGVAPMADTLQFSQEQPRGMPYQKALSVVTEAAAAGRLPARLDGDDTLQALESLIGALPQSPEDHA